VLRQEKILECTYCKKKFISIKLKSGHFPRLCSDECFAKMKSYNAKGIKKQEYNGQFFDSNWEVKIAKWLDENNIIWLRPKTAVVWLDKNEKKHRYYADFYLQDFNVYLDPKNPYCITKQKEKLDIVEKQIKLIYGNPNFLIKEVSFLMKLYPLCRKEPF